jgi:hypothetical protein
LFFVFLDFIGQPCSKRDNSVEMNTQEVKYQSEVGRLEVDLEQIMPRTHVTLFTGSELNSTTA